MKTYEVKDGDTLSAIAERELGRADAWPEIWRTNHLALRQEQRRRFGSSAPQIGDPDWIFPGTVLRLPEQDGVAL